MSKQGKQGRSKCKCRSIPGMRKGQGLCQYHWDYLAYGKAWADQCHPNHAKTCTEQP